MTTPQRQLPAVNASTATLPVDQSSEARALKAWRPAEDLPPNTTMVSLLMLISGLEMELTPADQRLWSVQMDRLLDVAEAFSITIPNMDTLMDLYRETLSHLPADLMRLAVDRIIREKWYGRMPLPADILETVSSDLLRRKGLVSKAKVALLKVPKSQPTTTPNTSRLPPSMPLKKLLGEIRDPTPTEIEATRQEWLRLATEVDPQ